MASTYSTLFTNFDHPGPSLGRKTNLFFISPVFILDNNRNPAAAVAANPVHQTLQSQPGSNSPPLPSSRRSIFRGLQSEVRTASPSVPHHTLPQRPIQPNGNQCYRYRSSVIPFHDRRYVIISNLKASRSVIENSRSCGRENPFSFQVLLLMV